jgi:hypothetical protein
MGVEKLGRNEREIEERICGCGMGGPGVESEGEIGKNIFGKENWITKDESSWMKNSHLMS